MNDRIKELVNKTVSGEMYVYPVKTEYDRCDLLMPPMQMSCKRVCEFLARFKVYNAFCERNGFLRKVARRFDVHKTNVCIGIHIGNVRGAYRVFVCKFVAFCAFAVKRNNI